MTPAVSGDGWSLQSLLYVLIGAVYLPRRWLRNALIRRYRQPRELRAIDDEIVRRARRRFLIPFVLSILHVPFLACWTLSHYWLQRTAYDALLVIPAFEHPKQLAFQGLFPVRRTRATMHEVYFDLWLGGTIVCRATEDGRGVKPDLSTFAID